MTAQREFYGWKLVFILWLLDFLNMGFPLYGGAVINTYMLKEIPMPERIRLGLYNSEFFRWHFFHFGRGVHCSLGRSADICDWLDAASCGRPVALSLRFASVALL